jgi:hypothetical protein
MFDRIFDEESCSFNNITKKDILIVVLVTPIVALVIAALDAAVSALS